MAMRQRSGEVTATLPRQSTSLLHEDFQPRSERKEEAAATVILVHLSGFVKERIKITYAPSSRILMVNGERPLNDNRWSRFEEAFPIPENCDVDKIQGLFQQGILTITMPKKIIAQVRPAEEPKTIQKVTSNPKPREVQKEIPPPPNPTSAKTTAQKAPSPSKSAVEPTLQKMQKVVEDICSTAIEESQRILKTGQSLSPQKATTEPKSQMGEDATPPKVASTTDTQKQLNNIDQKSIKEKDALMKEIGKAEKFMERNMVKGKESVQNIAESAMAEMKKKRSSEDFIADKGKGIKTVTESAKEKVKDLTSRRLNEEERQTLVNVGAAVLMIVALGVGAYLYRHSSSIHKR